MPVPANEHLPDRAWVHRQPRQIPSIITTPRRLHPPSRVTLIIAVIIVALIIVWARISGIEFTHRTAVWFVGAVPALGALLHP